MPSHCRGTFPNLDTRAIPGILCCVYAYTRPVVTCRYLWSLSRSGEATGYWHVLAARVAELFQAGRAVSLMLVLLFDQRPRYSWLQNVQGRLRVASW